MKKIRILGLAILILCIVGLITYQVKPYYFHSATWHIKKGVQSLYLHDIKKMDVPLISQTKNLNCEATTAAMILQYYGRESNIDTIQAALPLNENPHKGFRGNVDGNIWGFDDYGVYAEPIADVMTKFGVPAKAYTNISVDFLKQKILAGKPAIIWVNISDPHPETKIIDVDGEKIKLISGEHVAVVSGYENGTWILNDPWKITLEDGRAQGQTIFVDDLDSIMWDDFDHMAVIVE